MNGIEVGKRMSEIDGKVALHRAGCRRAAGRQPSSWNLSGDIQGTGLSKVSKAR
jgi:hypothetical protein